MNVSDNQIHRTKRKERTFYTRDNMQRNGVPIVAAETGGFHGNNFLGNEIVTSAIIEQFVGDYTGEKEPRLVNVWSELPYHDMF
jgi:nitrogenase molybdenum-iron protein beta chain